MRGGRRQEDPVGVALFLKWWPETESSVNVALFVKFELFYNFDFA